MDVELKNVRNGWFNFGKWFNDPKNTLTNPFIVQATIFDGFLYPLYPPQTQKEPGITNPTLRNSGGSTVPRMPHGQKNTSSFACRSSLFQLVRINREWPRCWSQPRKLTSFSPETGPCSSGNGSGNESSSNHQFSGAMSVFAGVMATINIISSFPTEQQQLVNEWLSILQWSNSLKEVAKICGSTPNGI